MAARGIESAFRMLEGRWKMVIIFHLFDARRLRFSELERAIPAVSQKMLIQQLRELERDGIVSRTVYPQVPPKVEYGLTEWGKAMCPRSTPCSNGRRCGRSVRSDRLQSLLTTLDRDDFSLNRHPDLVSCLSMIFSENRFPLFGIML